MNKNLPQKKSRKKMPGKKKILLGILILFVIFTVAVVVNVLIQIHENGDYYQTIYNIKPEEEQQRIDYEEADFTEDIFEDDSYMALDRDIKFIEDSQSTEVGLSEDATGYGTDLVFFQKYFTCVINGDYTGYKDFFWDSYFDDDNNFAYPDEPFTMQKIYNISVKHLTSEDIAESTSVSKSYYFVKYMIYKNNGTFRHDLPADTTINLLFELTRDTDVIKISKIVKYID